MFIRDLVPGNEFISFIMKLEETRKQVADKHQMLQELRVLRSAIEEESNKIELLIPFTQDIESALQVEDYAKALKLMDDLEELMDLEFCERT